MTRMPRLLACLLLLVALPLSGEEGDAAKEESQKPIPEPTVVVTQHQGRFGGGPVRFRAVAGETYLRDEKGEPTASIFSFAYLREGVDDASTRPVIFLWNGGPGSSSIWLHMGTFGPWRAVVPSDASDEGAPPFEGEENVLTLLDIADLVFVDPVGTGFSRALGEHENEEFWGLRPDAESVAAFIREWITANQRWRSPKYIVGESFGTTRAAAVADLLEGGAYGVSLNGIVMVSQALDYAGSTPQHDNFFSFVTYVPTMAATAWYHHRVPDRPERLEDFLEQARRFAIDEYAPALLRGSTLDAETRARVAAGLARFTGLPRDYVERSDLRIIAWRFLKELLRDQGQALGRFDARYVGDDIDDVAELPEADPSDYGIDGAYTAVFHDVLARHLEVSLDRRYQVSAEGMDEWSWRPADEDEYWEPSWVNTARRLGAAMRRNPELRVLVASGYYDFATPFFDAEITFARHGIVRERVAMKYYEAGHMMYLHDPSREAFLRDVRAFVAGGGAQ